MRPATIRNSGDLAAVLKERRKQNGTTQTGLAQMYDLSRFTVVDAESGKGEPKLSTLITLLNGLGMQLVAVPNEMLTQVSLIHEPPAEDYDEPDLQFEIVPQDFKIDD